MAQRVGLYGGSFNPIHNGHLIVARAVAERLPLDRVVLLPSVRPPHKGDHKLLDAEHRATMVKLAIEGEPLFEFSDFDLTRVGPSYTVETVEHFREVLGAQVELHWIVGADSLAELTTWYRVPDLVDACRIVTAARPGWETIDWTALHTVLSDAQVAALKAGVLRTPCIDISSTDIRRRVLDGQSIRYLVPDAVCLYIERNALYRDRGC
jgi:nicotinate-nucleotide adenylyltransferase